MNCQLPKVFKFPVRHYIVHLGVSFLGLDYVLGKKQITYSNPGGIPVVSYSHGGGGKLGIGNNF